MSATRSPSLELIDNTDLPDVVTLLHSDVASEHNADDDNPEHTLEGSFTDNADAMTEVGNDPLPVPAVRFLSVDISSLWSRFVPFGANAHLDANVEVVQVRVHDSRIVKAIWVISLVIFFLAIIGCSYNLGLEEGIREAHPGGTRVATIVKVFDATGKEMASVHIVWR